MTIEVKLQLHICSGKETTPRILEIATPYGVRKIRELLPDYASFDGVSVQYGIGYDEIYLSTRGSIIVLPSEKT